MAEHTWLDVLLTMSGNRLSKSMLGIKNMGTVSNWIIRTAIVASYIIKTAYLLMRRNIPLVEIFKHLVYFTAELIIVFVIAKRRTRIITFIKSSACSPTSLTRICISSLIYLAVISLLHLVLEFAYLMRRRNMTVIRLLVLLGNMVHFICNYFICYPLFYIISLKMFSSYELRQTSAIRRQILACNVHPVKLMKDMKQLSIMRNEFEQLFNIIPFILLSILFVDIPAALLDINNDKRNTDRIYLIIYICYYIVDTGLYFMLALFLVHNVSRSAERTYEAASELIEIIQDKNLIHLYSNGWQSVIDSLKLYQNFSFTGSKLFRIDHNLVLTFVSAIITFSVLLIQLQTSS